MLPSDLPMTDFSSFRLYLTLPLHKGYPNPTIRNSLSSQPLCCFQGIYQKPKARPFISLHTEVCTPKVRDPAAVTAVAPASSVIRALCTCRKGDCALNLKLLLWNFLLTSLYLHRILEMEGLFQRSTWPSIPWIWDEIKKCQMHWPFRWMLKEKLSMMQLLDKDSQKTR